MPQHVSQLLLRSGPGAWLRPHRPLLSWRPLLEQTNRPSPTPPTVTFSLSTTMPVRSLPPPKGLDPAALEAHAAAVAARLEGLQHQVATLQAPQITAAALAAPATRVEVQGELDAAAQGRVVVYNADSTYPYILGNNQCAYIRP